MSEIQDPTTQGLLCLPAELRLDIYRHLHNEERSNIYRSPETHLQAISSRLFRLPITKVCRTLRSETLPIRYAKHYLYLPLPYIHTITNHIRWLRTVDSYALRCMKGVKVENHRHTSKTWQGDVTTVETKTISFGNGMASVTEKYLGGCCESKAKFDELRDSMVGKFMQKVESQPGMLKEELIWLVQQLDRLNGERGIWYQ